MIKERHITDLTGWIAGHDDWEIEDYVARTRPTDGLPYQMPPEGAVDADLEMLDSGWEDSQGS